MTVFRPCIDLHEGKVKQIVGGSLRDDGSAPETNFVSERGAGFFAQRYRDDDLVGGHVIRLGQGNDDAAQEALEVIADGKTYLDRARKKLEELEESDDDDDLCPDNIIVCSGTESTCPDGSNGNWCIIEDECLGSPQGCQGNPQAQGFLRAEEEVDALGS